MNTGINKSSFHLLQADGVSAGSEQTSPETPGGVIRMNEETGVMELVSNEQAGSEAEQAAASAPPVFSGPPLQRLRFEGQVSSPGTYQSVVTLDGMKVNVDLFTDAEFEAYETERRRIAELMIDLGRFSGSPDDAQAKSAEIHKAQRAHKDGVIAAKVKGFEGVKVSLEQRLSLFLPDKVRICDLILQRSHIGYADTDFSQGS